MVIHHLAKVKPRVRFPLPAPESNSVREFARAKSDLAFIYINIIKNRLFGGFFGF